MTNTSPAEVLRRAIANVIAGESARDVPGVCKRYGLAEGIGEEAFSGKFRYVMSRLHALNTAQVLQTGQAVLGDYRDSALANAVEVLEDANLPKITMITRRRLLNILNSIVFEGRLSLFEFLEPVYDLDSIPSPYHVSPTGESTRPIRGDIYQHCINNHDWDNEDLLKHLGFLDGHQRQVFSLLERVFDPEIWDDDHPEGGLLDRINQVLKKDGYALQVTGMISGTGIYKVQQIGPPGATPADDEISALVQRFDEAGIRDLWEKALQRRHSDPGGAITIARTYLEQTCKHILDEEGFAYPDDIDLPKLWTLCAKQINLAPNQHTEEAFKSILGSCQNVVNTLGTIRNRIGDSHGQRGKPVRAKPRHAQLAVNLAGSMAMFLLATWEEHRSRVGSDPAAE
uniref:abortive infection family protein n=1 Tax=Methylobacterium oryzae TaxID=334852 RepID=UPI00155DB3D5|nr:abortive infection family protein [Methylobacterium oryzae]